MKKKITQNQVKNLLAKAALAKSCKVCNTCHQEQPLINFFHSFIKDKNKINFRNKCKNCRQQQISIEKRLLKDAKYRAKKKNLFFNLKESDIKIPDVCPIFKTPLIYRGGFDAPSIDRIDNTKGYTKDNIIVVSLRANNYKSSATIEQLKQLVTFYEELMSHK